MNLCLTSNPWSLRGITLTPNVWIDEPLAARRTDPGGELLCAADAGKTETSAPLSTRKGRRSRLQKTDSAPADDDGEGLTAAEREEIVGRSPGVTADPRRPRFPKL